MISKKDKYNSDKILDVEKTHLVYTINSLRKTGPVNVLGSMIKYIDHNNYKVSIVAFLPGDAPGKVIASNPDVSYTCLNLSSKLDIITKGPKALEELLSVSRVDIVHSHGILANIASYKSNSAYNHVATIHNSIFEDYRYTFGRLKGFLFAQWHLYYLRKFEKVVCCSKTSYRQVQKYLPNAQSITNGNDLMTLKTNSETIAATRRALGIAKNDIAYIYMGKLSRLKNIIKLLEDFSSTGLSNEHLLVLGDGELSAECSKYASLNVHILGFKTDTATLLEAADVYVSASKSEGFSISIIDALSRGLYLLLSDIPSHKELFEIDKSVYIGEVFGSHSFKIAKERLLDKISTRDVPAAFHRRYLTAETMMRKYENVYNETLK